MYVNINNRVLLNIKDIREVRKVENTKVGIHFSDGEMAYYTCDTEYERDEVFADIWREMSYENRQTE